MTPGEVQQYPLWDKKPLEGLNKLKKQKRILISCSIFIVLTWIDNTIFTEVNNVSRFMNNMLNTIARLFDDIYVFAI